MLAFERVVDVATHPVLKSHVIKGRAVVPTALMVEWLAAGAMHEHPGMMFCGFEGLRILKGVTLKKGESVRVRDGGGGGGRRDGMEFVAVELKSGDVVHARATIVLGAALPVGEASEVPGVEQAYTSALYGDGRLFHGEDLHAIKEVMGWSEEGIVAVSAGAPPECLDEAAVAVELDCGADGARCGVSVDDFVVF